MRRAFVAIAVLVMLSGCATYTAGVGTSVISATDMPNQLVKANNPLMNQRLTFEHAGLQSLEDGRKEAFITLRSTYKYDQPLQYQFYWYTNVGREVSKTPWQPIVLHGDQQLQLQSVAPSLDATAFRVYVRRAD